MRTPLAPVTLATLGLLAARGHADERRATVAVDLYQLYNDFLDRSLYDSGSFTVATLGAELRVDQRTWVVATFGAVSSDVYDDTWRRVANPVLGVRFDRSFGRVALRGGLDVTLPLASVSVDGGVRNDAHVDTLRGASDARGRWNGWAWFPEWMSVVIPVRATVSSGPHLLSLEAAGGVAYAVGGEHADATTAAVGQIGLEERYRFARRVSIEGRLALTGMQAGDDFEGNGGFELGLAYELDDGMVRARLGLPFDSYGGTHPMTLLLGATWWR